MPTPAASTSPARCLADSILAAVAAAALVAAVAPSARAADRVKADNTTSMSSGASWVGGVAPGTGDTGVFDSTFTQAGRFGTGAPLSWLGLRVTTGSSLLDVDNTSNENYLGILTGGIDMSVATRDLRVTSLRQQASHTWNIATGRTLTVGLSASVADNGLFEQTGGSVLSLAGGGTISISRAAAAIVLGDASTFTGSLTTGTDAVSLFADTNDAFSFAGSLSTSAAVTKTGAGAYALAANNSLGATSVTVSAGTLQLGDGGTAGTLGSGSVTLDAGATLAFDRSDAFTFTNTINGFLTTGGSRSLSNNGSSLVTISTTSGNIGSSIENATLILTGSGDGVITDSVANGGGRGLSLQKTGTGTWTLTSDSNNYSGGTATYPSGGTTISAGTLQIGNGGATGSMGPGDLTLEAGATLAFNRTAPISLANDWIGFTDGGTRTLRNDGTGKVTLNGGNIGLSSGTTTLALVGSGDGEIAQSIAAGGAAIAVLKDDAGTWTLSNTATNYSGTTTITAGTLEVTGLIGAGTYAQAIANDGELHINTASAQTLSGDLSGTGRLRKSASGTLTLSGTNSYTGGTTLAAGTLALASADALGPSGTLTLSGGTLQFSASNTTDYSARFSTAAGQAFNLDTNGQDIALATALTSSGGSLAKSGSGTLTLSAANTYDGTTTITAGTLRIADGGSLGSGDISIPDGTLEFTRSTATSIANQFVVQGTGSTPALLNNGSGLLTLQPGTSTNISVDDGETFTIGGSGDIRIEKSIASGANSALLTKTGTGTVTLTSASNAWSGGTTIAGGVLQVGDGTSDGTIGSGTITITNGRLAFDRPNPYTVAETIATFTVGTTPGIENNGAGLLTIQAANLGFNNGASLTFGGTGDGIVDGPIAQGGASASILKDGAGTWTINDADTNYTGSTTINAGTLEITGLLGKGTYAQAITNDATLHFNTTSNQAISGAISGTGLLQKSAASTLTLSATNTYSGDTTISAGTLTVSGALGSGSYAGAIANDGTLSFTTNSNQTLSGAISGSGSLTKSGSGTLTLSGANTSTGSTTITAGTLRITEGSGIAAAAISLSDGTLEFTRTSATTLANDLSVSGSGSSPALINNGTGLLTIQPGSATNITVDNGETFTVGGSGDIVIEKSIASGAGASLLTKTGSGTVTLTSSANNWSGGTTITAGVLQVGDGTSDGTIGSGTITITNGRLAFNRPNPYTVAETIATFQGSTTPGIENNGAGLLTINASNLAFAVAGIPLAFGGTGDGLVDGPIAVGGAAASILKDGSGTWTINDPQTNYSGSTTISAGTLEVTGRLGQGSYAQPIANDATLHFNSTSNQTLSGVISGAGTLKKSAAGTLTLDAANTFTGLLLIDGGTMALAAGGSLATAVSAEVNGGTFDIAGTTQTIASLNGTGGAVALGAGSLTVNNAVANAYAGAIGGTGAFVKSGAGDLVLSGTSTYTGTTTVTAGRLSVNGGLGNTAVTVQAGAELGGSGSIVGGLTVNNGGTLAPGNSIASLAAGSTTFDAGSTFDYEVDSTNVGSLGTAADLLVVSGDLSIVSGTVLSFTDINNAPNAFADGTIFALINYTGSWDAGVFTYKGQVLADGDRFFVGAEEWQIDYDSTTAGLNFTGDYVGSNFVTVTAVPEPTTLVLVAAAAGLAAILRRRRA